MERPGSAAAENVVQAGFTFSARGPFGPWPMVKVTCSPSRIESNGVPTQAVLTDIAVDESAASAVANAIDGATPDDDTVMSILRAADLGNLALNGKSFLELMANDALISSLTTARIVVTTSEGRLRAAEAELTA